MKRLNKTAARVEATSPCRPPQCSHFVLFYSSYRYGGARKAAFNQASTGQENRNRHLAAPRSHADDPARRRTGRSLTAVEAAASQTRRRGATKMAAAAGRRDGQVLGSPSGAGNRSPLRPAFPMHVPGRNSDCQRFQVSCGLLLRRSRRRSRERSISQSAHAKQAPRQPDISNKRNTRSKSVSMLMHAALQHACQRRYVFRSIFFRRIVKF
jgi:hypothetical protein